MTDDEAFIRAILDSPGDEGPRLVYADWLEERGDSRSAYVRAEMDWAERWPVCDRIEESAEMAQTGAGLDPVWVARVTRPPAGACCDHIQICDSGSILPKETIDVFERECGIKLPHDYRAFLLNYNGGIVDPILAEMPDGHLRPQTTEFCFYGLGARPRGARTLLWWKVELVS
jgi:uncharacterized protein (TIGR02996 family)